MLLESIRQTPFETNLHLLQMLLRFHAEYIHLISAQANIVAKCQAMGLCSIRS
jgi:hypothetical protein